MTLDLGNVITTTVYVQYDTTNGLQFSPDNTTWVSGPIHWDPLATSTTVLTLTFSFQGAVSSIAFNSANITQSGNIFTIPTTPGNDLFTVYTASNGPQSSMIAVIQPLNLGHTTTPQTVNVQYVNEGVQFSTNPDNGQWYTGPINWSPTKGSKASLALTFICSDGTTGVTTTSPNITQSTNNQGQPVFTITPTKAYDFFSVTKGDGSAEDPQIIVTPQ